MAVLDPRTWLEILPETECWRLLRLSSVGRIAVVTDDGPMIWPINIAVDEHVVVFRTGPGSKLAALGDSARAAIEVDGLDFDELRGWSVVATGRLHELSGTRLTHARSLPLVPWTVGEKARWFGLAVDRISGRAIADRAAAGAPDRPS